MESKVGEPILDSFGEPDPGNVFVILVKGRRFEDKMLDLKFNERGVLSSFDGYTIDRTGEVVGKSLRSLATIASKVAFPTPPGGAAGTFKPADAVREADGKFKHCGFCDLLRDSTQVTTCKAKLDFLDCDAFLKLNPRQRAKVLEELRTADVARTLLLLEATRAYGELVDLNELRFEALEVGNIGSAIGAERVALVLKEIDGKIASIEEDFFGTSAIKESKQQFEVVLTTAPTSLQQIPLFRYSSPGAANLCRINNAVAGVEIRSSTLLPGVCNATTAIELCVEPIGNSVAGNLQGLANIDLKEKTGIFYRVPAPAKVWIASGACSGPLVGSAVSLQMAQLGKTLVLPVTTGGRKTQYTFDLSGKTGALENFKLTSEVAFDPALLENLQGAATELIDAEQKGDAAKAAANDELAKLKREREILDEKLKIKKATDELAKEGGENEP